MPWQDHTKQLHCLHKACRLDVPHTCLNPTSLLTSGCQSAAPTRQFVVAPSLHRPLAELIFSFLPRMQDTITFLFRKWQEQTPSCPSQRQSRHSRRFSCILALETASSAVLWCSSENFSHPAPSTHVYCTCPESGCQQTSSRLCNALATAAGRLTTAESRSVDSSVQFPG